MNHFMGVSILMTHQQIERKRKEMLELAAIYGINNQLTIQCSQELDQLLNKLDQRVYNRKSA
ncbi:aspartyl-phosphate phosphatase Spo0E family protein [Calidifontibacillus oryziterrae]|uniref:aspartyl-phosphate phosphatase Spo0E family protein n=1 Tax=Calidifontibacillus oryziterrae TaxID=1191699 RepID=UPI0002E8D5E1|nr:aspartyl-phosphate phosphatase Spo0E family protein [Calidifontibacillus oryziterrae]